MATTPTPTPRITAKQWKTIGIWISIGAALVTAWNGVSAYAERVRLDRDRAILEWQEPEVFRLIADADRPGITFNDLLGKYQVSGLSTKETEVPKDKLQEAALRRVLISLIDKRAVLPLGKDKFRLYSQLDMCGAAQVPANELYNQYGAVALAAIDKVNGQQEVRQVLQLFQEQFKITNGDAQLLLHMLMALQSVGIHRQSHLVWNVITHPDMLSQVHSGGGMIVIQNSCGPAPTRTGEASPTPSPDPSFSRRRPPATTEPPDDSQPLPPRRNP